MAAAIKAFSSLLFSLIVFFLLLLLPHACIDAQSSLKVCKFDGIYQLGDSVSDTGNLIREKPALPFARLPYGQTFFKKPTGRCSNGLLIIDYIAQAAGIPLLDPSLDEDALFTRGRGENFAVAGSTALSAEVLAQKNISPPLTNSSLSVQLDWMLSHFNGICINPNDCVEKLKTALFIVGEIGGHDYEYALFQGKSIEEVTHLVPEVVQAIKDAVTKVISNGGARVVVPGLFPIGCLPIYLTGFHTNKLADYDESHCLKRLNALAIYHNDQLKQAIEVLRKENPGVVIVYGDYYNAFQWVFSQAPRLGFDAASVQKSCCGVGGDYLFSKDRMCGNPGVAVCANPDERISWDGVHMTAKANQHIANRVIQDILPTLNCKA